jgi:hypothetical protein
MKSYLKFSIIKFFFIGTHVSFGNGKKFDSYFIWNSFCTSTTFAWGINYPYFLNDIDADGFVDILTIGSSAFYSTKYNNSINTATSDTIAAPYWSLGKQNRYLVDLNNDNLPDYIGITDDNNVYVGVSGIVAGKVVFNHTRWGSISSVKATNKRYQTLSDLNGDGYPDLAVFDCDGVYVMMNNGQQQFNPPKLWNTEVNLCDLALNTYPKSVVDVDGDGLGDIIEFYDSNVRVAFNANKKPRLAQITDSLSNEKSFKYDDLADVLFVKDESLMASESYKSNGINFDVVSAYSSSDGVGGKSTVQYKYSNYFCNKTQGRNTCSFSSIRYQNFDSNLYYVDEFYLDFPLTGMLKSKKSFADNVLLFNKKFSYTFRTNKDPSYIGAKANYEVFLASNLNDYFDLSGSYLKSEVNLKYYDDVGNVYFSIENTTDTRMNYSKTISYQYKKSAANINTWYINQLESKLETYLTQSPTSLESKLIEQKFEYSQTSRLLLKKTHLPNEKIGLEQSYVYNSYGNVLSIVDKDLTSLEVRAKNFSYDANGLNILNSVNEMGHKRSFQYDMQDNLILANDSNGVVTNYVYSLQGNKIFEAVLGTANKTFYYNWDSSMPNSVYSIASFADGGVKKKQFYDSLNRVIRTMTFGFKYEQLYEDTVYIVRRKVTFFCLFTFRGVDF